MYFAKRLLFWLIPFFRINRFQNDSVHCTFGGGMTRTVFRSFWNWNVTQKNASCFSSVCSLSGIVPKECSLRLCKRLCWGGTLNKFRQGCGYYLLSQMYTSLTFCWRHILSSAVNLHYYTQVYVMYTSDGVNVFYCIFLWEGAQLNFTNYLSIINVLSWCSNKILTLVTTYLYYKTFRFWNLGYLHVPLLDCVIPKLIMQILPTIQEEND